MVVVSKQWLWWLSLNEIKKIKPIKFREKICYFHSQSIRFHQIIVFGYWPANSWLHHRNARLYNTGTRNLYTWIVSLLFIDGYCRQRTTSYIEWGLICCCVSRRSISQKKRMKRNNRICKHKSFRQNTAAYLAMCVHMNLK